VRLWDNPFQGGIWLAVEMDAQFNLSQDSWLPATDYPRASRSFPRIAGSGNEIEAYQSTPAMFRYDWKFWKSYWLWAAASRSCSL
jgi:hypothetical protein